MKGFESDILSKQGKTDCTMQERCLAYTRRMMRLCSDHEICSLDYQARTGNLPAKRSLYDEERRGDAEG